ncbi:hypothetical protein R3P38DRAFT_3219129 [Favolaschia claudopus]|uniref:Uncharacterized protein n=1 Tax=Favolaschia claudopus TaxID=2862362 RepID=A0AAW0A2U5_9AGAR
MSTNYGIQYRGLSARCGQIISLSQDPQQQGVPSSTSEISPDTSSSSYDIGNGQHSTPLVAIAASCISYTTHADHFACRLPRSCYFCLLYPPLVILPAKRRLLRRPSHLHTLFSTASCNYIRVLSARISAQRRMSSRGRTSSSHIKKLTEFLRAMLPQFLVLSNRKRDNIDPNSLTELSLGRQQLLRSKSIEMRRRESRVGERGTRLRGLMVNKAPGAMRGKVTNSASALQTRTTLNGLGEFVRLFQTLYKSVTKKPSGYQPRSSLTPNMAPIAGLGGNQFLPPPLQGQTRTAIRTGGHQYSGASSTGPANIQLDHRSTFRTPADLVYGKLHVFFPHGQRTQIHVCGLAQTADMSKLVTISECLRAAGALDAPQFAPRRLDLTSYTAAFSRYRVVTVLTQAGAGRMLDAHAVEDGVADGIMGAAERLRVALVASRRPVSSRVGWSASGIYYDTKQSMRFLDNPSPPRGDIYNYSPIRTTRTWVLTMATSCACISHDGLDNAETISTFFSLNFTLGQKVTHLTGAQSTYRNVYNFLQDLQDSRDLRRGDNIIIYASGNSQAGHLVYEPGSPPDDADFNVGTVLTKMHSIEKEKGILPLFIIDICGNVNLTGLALPNHCDCVLLGAASPPSDNTQKFTTKFLIRSEYAGPTTFRGLDSYCRASATAPKTEVPLLPFPPSPLTFVFSFAHSSGPLNASFNVGLYGVGAGADSGGSGESTFFPILSSLSNAFFLSSSSAIVPPIPNGSTQYHSMFLRRSYREPPTDADWKLSPDFLLRTLFLLTVPADFVALSPSLTGLLRVVVCIALT